MTKSRLRIAIATNGRFHVLDLARELVSLGMDVTFYSLLPNRRAEQFGLDSRFCRSVFPAMAPLIAWQRLAPKAAPGTLERWHAHSLNRAIRAKLEPCDVFIGMSGLIVEAAQTARERYGARIFVERGSKHIDVQAAILAEQDAEGPSPFAIDRERRSYAMADRIMIPAEHVRRSFDHDRASIGKLMINPYGVDLNDFPQHTAPRKGAPTVVFSGGWLRRKGVDVLVEALRLTPEIRFIHIGGRGDFPFPNDPRFEHVDPVDQHRLREFYEQADAFAIASREEGLALVQIQALASGLPLVCTDQTGGRDLAYTPALANRIIEVPVEDATALAAAMRRAIQIGRAGGMLPPADRDRLSWRAYAERYHEHIERDLTEAGRP
ncbi:MAG: glycosyltransferase family 4 protein [Sphingomonas sp.]|uniref:glycosyltransferase family 4 protein n=1 Tax=Sphingomonas sp. TaxID=28214 RepID=UPI001ACADF66|nr:glycosyltransferase family 4 protein [Sphingomonas sp.]MBN8806908.1 glycosyltransferase family 4 protein [Sphingomonas sp.]